MNKTILSMLCAFIVSGCAINDINTAETERPKKQPIFTEYDTQDSIYHAMVGSLMEYSSQNNNAINHYETILNKGYNKDIVNKLLNLYNEKNDLVGLYELLKSLEKKQVINNHSQFSLPYFIIIEDYENAVDTTLSYIEKTEHNKNFNNSITQRSRVYYSIIESLQFIEIVSNEKNNAFLNKLRKENNSSYLTIKTNFKDKTILESIDYEKYDLNKLDLGIFYLLDYYQNPNIKKLNKVSRAGFDILELKNEILIHYSQLLKEKNYEEMKTLSLKLKKENEYPKKFKFYEYLSYLFMFETKNALYVLEDIKSDISSDFYYYGKAILNYRLGYKNAAKRYMSNVEDIKLIKGNMAIYFDLIDDRRVLLNNFDEIEIKNLEFSYYLEKRDIISASRIQKELEIIIKENNITDDYFEFNTIFLTYLKDENKGLKEAEYYYDMHRDKASTNFYAYLLALSNKDIEKGINLIKPYIENGEKEASILDTYAWLLYKNKKYKEALNVYLKNNMIYSQDATVQNHLSKIYQKLGNKNKYNFHKKASQMILKK